MPEEVAFRPQGGRVRKRVFALVALLLASVISILVIELAIRAFWPHRVRTPFALEDPRFLYRNEPGVVGYQTAPGEFGYGFTVNSLGFRGPEVAVEPPPGALRILCVGDSFTWGSGVEDDETYPAQLARILSEGLPEQTVEVVNAGVMSWGVSQYYRWILEEGFDLDPDVIVIAMFHDDWTQALLGLVMEGPDGSLQTEDRVFDELRTQRELLGSIPGFRWMMTNSQLLNWVRDSLRTQVTWPPGTHAFTKVGEGPPGSREVAERERKERERKQQAFRLAEKMLQELASESSARKIPVVLAWIPHRRTIHALLEGQEAPYADNDAAKLAFEKVLTPQGVRLVDPREEIVAELETTGMDVYELYFRRDGHFYPRGYEILAAVVAPAVLEALDRRAR